MAERLPPDSGSLDLGLAADMVGAGAFLDLSGRVGHDLALFGRAEAMVPYSSAFDVAAIEASIIAGLRYRW